MSLRGRETFYGEKYSFPEYVKEELPVLRENEDGNTLMRIDFQGQFPEGKTGSLDLVWADDEDEPLILHIKKAADKGSALGASCASRRVDENRV